MATVTTLERATTLVAQLGGLAILAGTLAALAAFLYRWYVREAIPRGLSLLVGLSAVAVYLNTTTALGGVIGGSTAPTGIQEALFNIAAFGVAAGGAVGGRRVGDRFGTDVVLDSGFGDIERDVGNIVRSVGRIVTVKLPEEIDDVVGYDPLPEETKDDLAGKTFIFPRGLTVEELRDRLVSRLKTDYAAGHVDVDLADDGTVEYLALGSRAAGIGPTLPPATNAVAIRADPAFAASAGDIVQVWETDPMRRLLTAELRGVSGDTATIAIDAADTPRIDPREEYRLVTLPVTDRPDREFASLLRAAEETFSSVTVEAGSPAHGMPVGSLDITIVSVQPESGETVTLPGPKYVLAPGDTVFAIARPESLRRLETATRPLDPSLVRTIGKPEPAGQRGPAPEEASSPGADTRPAPDEPPARTPEEPESDQGEPPETVDPTDGTAAESDESSVEGRAGTNSFQQLKAEFESGEAEWAASGADVTDEDHKEGNDETEPAADAGFENDLEGLDPGKEDERRESDAGTGPGLDLEDDGGEMDDGDEGFSFGESDDVGGEGSDDGLDGLDFEDDANGGDLESLDIDDDGDDALSGLEFDDSEEGDDEDGKDTDGEDGDGDDEDEDEDEDEVAEETGSGKDDDGQNEEGSDDGEGEDSEGDDGEESSGGDGEESSGGDGDESDGSDNDDDGGGGAASFQQLKEEFESGEADWADDVGSPGGDMRLDE